ncbi:MAG: type IV pilus twitching motility protein PilT [Clostridia bacterium]
MREISYFGIDPFLQYVCDKNGTDLHINVHTKPRIRLNSVLCEIENAEVLNAIDTENIVHQLLDDAKSKYLEENGDVDFSFSRFGLGRFRVNVYKQRGTYSIAVRRLPFDIPPFSDLRLPDVIKSFAKKNKGLVLVTGPTGSGKSTTLASMIDMINKERKAHIITIEDPIEYLHQHKESLIDQREVGSDTKSFASALRATLREDPDVILVGEMRDPETISIALTAAETGHLVFSTLHTIGAAKTVDRIIDSFPPNQQNQIKSQLATVLEGVVSQHLIPKMNGKGIVAASEVMVVNSAIRNLIREGKSFQINSVIQTSANVGMQTMDTSLAQLYTSGVIAQEEAVARAQDPKIFSQLSNTRWS